MEELAAAFPNSSFQRSTQTLVAVPIQLDSLPKVWMRNPWGPKYPVTVSRQDQFDAIVKIQSLAAVSKFTIFYGDTERKNKAFIRALKSYDPLFLAAQTNPAKSYEKVTSKYLFEVRRSLVAHNDKITKRYRLKIDSDDESMSEEAHQEATSEGSVGYSSTTSNLPATLVSSKSTEAKDLVNLPSYIHDLACLDSYYKL